MSDQGSRLGESDRQLALEVAVARGAPAAAAVAAGARQPALLSPLTELDLANGDGYAVGITSIDMTPRPRYRESPSAFVARMRAMGADLAELTREVKLRNRRQALRSLGDLVWTQCACGWCGLRVGDPEVARREYDAHDCAAANMEQSAVDRAIAETDKVTLAKRTKHVLQPALTAPAEDAPVVSAVEQDGTEQRFALLELK